MRDQYVRATVLLVLVIGAGLVTYRFLFWQAKETHQENQRAIGSYNKKTERSDNRFVVKRVIDGDTVSLDNGETVRLIGVDAPETNHPEIPVQRFGEEATAFLRRMVDGFEVTLEYEGKREDAYGRTLAYVFVDGTCVNKEIVRRGYGYAYTRFPHSRQDEFIEAEREARAKQYGLWNYSLTDARIANLANRYERLSPEGKGKLEKAWDKLLLECPASKVEKKDND